MVFLPFNHYYTNHQLRPTTCLSLNPLHTHTGSTKHLDNHFDFMAVRNKNDEQTSVGIRKIVHQD